ncbi:MAG: hypothetical protein ACRYF2_02725, partial [Janthinobacterium lividum]
MTVFWPGSPPPRIGISVQSVMKLALKLVNRSFCAAVCSHRRPQHDPMGNFARRHHPPQGNKQFPG